MKSASNSKSRPSAVLGEAQLCNQAASSHQLQTQCFQEIGGTGSGSTAAAGTLLPLVMALLLGAAGLALPAPAEAAGGQCEWEGDAGAPTYLSCVHED